MHMKMQQIQTVARVKDVDDCAHLLYLRVDDGGGASRLQQQAVGATQPENISQQFVRQLCRGSRCTCRQTLRSGQQVADIHTSTYLLTIEVLVLPYLSLTPTGPVLNNATTA